MNVVFLTNQTYPSGMAGSKRIRLFAEYLASQNIVTSVFIYTKSNGQNENIGTYNSVKYQFIKFHFYNLLFKNKFLINSIKNLYDRNTKNYLIIYGGLNIESYISVSILKEFGYKILVDLVEDYSVIEENISSKLALRFILNSILNERKLNKIDGFIVISNYLKNKLLKNNINKKIIKLIPISAENINYKLKKSSKRKFFRYLYSGTYGNKDGIVFLIEAYMKLLKKYPDVELFLTGKVGRIKKHYKYIEKLDSKHNIKFLGRIPDEKYYDILHGSDALLMTRIDSEYANSGFPFKLGEYLATGNPVISTNVSDIANYLRNRIDIIFTNPSDSESLFEAMEYVYLNFNDCEEIGKNGKKAAEKYFNPKNNGEMLYRFLDEL